MGNVLNPNYLNIPEQVEVNTRKLEASKIYRTTLNLTSGTSSIPIETTNIDDIKKVIENSVIFSANGLMFLIKAFTKNSVLVEFYADLSSVNYLITQFDFETDEIIYQDDSAEFKGEIKYADDDELTDEKIAPANIKLKIKGGNQITIDVDESGKILIVKIDEDFLTQIEETIELSSENEQQLQRCLKIPISTPIKTQIVGVNSANSQVMIDIDDESSTTSENPVQNKAISKAVNLNMLGVPSNENWVDISLPNETTIYTAPDNGYIVVYFEATSGDSAFKGVRMFNMGNNNISSGSLNSVIKGGNACYIVPEISRGDFSVSIPVKQGDNVKIIFQQVTINKARFIPSEEV